MLRMDPATLRTALEQLQQAAHDHAEWQQKLLRAARRGVSPDRDDRAAFAHLVCGFDRRYFERLPAALWGEPSFATLGIEHEHLHALADELLRLMASDAAAVRLALKELVEQTARLRRLLHTLQQEVRDALRNRDALTGAEGRAEMLPELQHWHDLARRRVQPCCIVLMGVDRLTAINEAHGRPVGDRVLAATVERVSRRLRPYDKVFRYEGDEFLIALPGTDLAIGQLVIKRVREALAGRPLATGPSGAAYPVTASFGLAALDPDVSVEESIERAAQALLLAKAAGRNRAIHWDPTVQTGTRLPRLQVEDIKV